MKKSLIRPLSLCLLAIILTACGNDQTTTQDPGNSNEPVRFKIGATTWQVNLPGSWEASPLKIPGTIFVGQHQDQNFIIAQKPGYDSETITRIKNKAIETFFDFTLVKETNSTLTFDGKLGIEDSLRRFHEKILPVPGTDSYLIGICSYDYWLDRNEVCSQILDDWRAEEVTNN